MTAPYYLFKNDIANRNVGFTSLGDAALGAGWIATLVNAGVTTNSEWKMSQWSAYENLRQKLNDGNEKLPLQSTTTQRDLLTGIKRSTVIDNITVGRLEKYNGTKWINVSRRSNAENIIADPSGNQAGGTLLIADLNILGTVAANNDSVVLPLAAQSDTCIVFNKGAKKAKIFPFLGDDLGNGQNTAITLPKSSIIVFYKYGTTKWAHLHISRDGSMAPSAFGDMYENNETGSAMNSSTKNWITATMRALDDNGIVTFLNDAAGDRLVIGAEGAGKYEIHAKCDQTNAGGNITTMTVFVNGVASTILDEHASDSGDHRPLYSFGTLDLVENDYLMINAVSSTPGDVITGYHVALFIKRLT